jgi:hypothetical protein
MLSLDERAALLKQELQKAKPQAVLDELKSYANKGPLAYSYLEEKQQK